MLLVTSIMLTSYYQFILAQGDLGLSNGLTYSPTVTAFNQYMYFFQKRPIAMEIASSGSSLAGVIFPIALSRMFNKSTLGFGWSVRVVGFLMLVWSIISCAVILSNAFKRKSGFCLLLGNILSITYRS